MRAYIIRYFPLTLTPADPRCTPNMPRRHMACGQSTPRRLTVTPPRAVFIGASAVVGRGHVSPLALLDPWHSKHFRDIAHPLVYSQRTYHLDAHTLQPLRLQCQAAQIDPRPAIQQAAVPRDACWRDKSCSFSFMSFATGNTNADCIFGALPSSGGWKNVGHTPCESIVKGIKPLKASVGTSLPAVSVLAADVISPRKGAASFADGAWRMLPAKFRPGASIFRISGSRFELKTSQISQKLLPVWSTTVSSTMRSAEESTSWRSPLTLMASIHESAVAPCPPVARVRSHCRFRKRGTDSLS